MANRSRSMILKGEYKAVSKFVVPLVTSLHPATTVLTKLVKKIFEEASKLDNTIDLISPKSTLGLQGFFIFQVCLPPFHARVFSQDTWDNFLVYYLVCKSNRKECQHANYVGRALTNDRDGPITRATTRMVMIFVQWQLIFCPTTKERIPKSSFNSKFSSLLQILRWQRL